MGGYATCYRLTSERASGYWRRALRQDLCQGSVSRLGYHLSLVLTRSFSTRQLLREVSDALARANQSGSSSPSLTATPPTSFIPFVPRRNTSTTRASSTGISSRRTSSLPTSLRTRLCSSRISGCALVVASSHRRLRLTVRFSRSSPESSQKTSSAC